jgi:thiamine monophosphate synthase
MRLLDLPAGRSEFVRAANELPAQTIDYIGVGPVRATSSKLDAEVYGGAQIIQGVHGIAEVASLSSVPVVAGGGGEQHQKMCVR